MGFRLLPPVFDAMATPLLRLGGLERATVSATPGNVLAPHPAAEAVHGAWGRHWLRPLVPTVAALTFLTLRRPRSHPLSDPTNRGRDLP